MGLVQDRCCEKTGSTTSNNTPAQVVYPNAPGTTPKNEGGSATRHDNERQQQKQQELEQDYQGQPPPPGPGENMSTVSPGGGFAEKDGTQEDYLESSPLTWLDGVWYNDEGQLMGSIVNGVIQWDAQFNHPETSLRVVGDGGIAMDLVDATHFAEFSQGHPSRLRWSDGDLWVRQAEA
mmetsp:Transcript_131955/g.329134  ORF Transcript_131955/g.329134 Transcript_131955/m.329134 type:complete len:178 (-) Transcript_131955:35-568(-)